MNKLLFDCPSLEHTIGASSLLDFGLAFLTNICTFNQDSSFIFSALLEITLPSSGGWSSLSCGLIKPSARLDVHDIKIQPSLLATKNVTSVIHLVSGCIIYKLQDPKILTFLLVYVSNSKSLGAILAQSGSLNKYL